MTRSELPSVVRRKTSLTMRHRFTPASTFSTTTRALERRRLRNLASTLNSWPFGFFGAAGSAPPLAHSPENPCPSRASHWWDSISGRHRRLSRSEEHTSELQSQSNLVCRLLLEKKQN